MTWDQISGFVQRILMFGGGFAVAKGWISEQLMVQIVGGIIAAGGLLWGVKVNTKSSLVQSVTQMPEVNSQKLVAAIEDPDLKQVARENATL